MDAADLATLKRAVTLVDGLAELADPADFAVVVLPALCELIGCEVASHNEIGTGGSAVQYSTHPAGALDGLDREAFAAHVHEHPLVNHYRATGDGAALRMSDLIDLRAFHRLGLYAEFFRHVPAEHQLAVTVAVPGTAVVGIALNRARGDFTDSERDLLGAVRGPLVAGLGRARARRSAREALTSAEFSATPAQLRQTGQPTLTDRELAVLALVAQGRTNVAIAHSLGISPRTVAKHLEQMYRKLGVANRAGAVHRAGGAVG